MIYQNVLYVNFFNLDNSKVRAFELSNNNLNKLTFKIFTQYKALPLHEAIMLFNREAISMLYQNFFPNTIHLKLKPQSLKLIDGISSKF